MVKILAQPEIAQTGHWGPPGQTTQVHPQEGPWRPAWWPKSLL